MVLITNFGDVTTTGNMTVQNTLTVQGVFSSLSGILVGAGPVTIGNVTSGFSQIYVATMNTTTMNVTSLYGNAGFIGVGTTNPSGTTLYVQGNVYTSNTLTTPNIFSPAANITAINTGSIISSTGFLGIGTTNPSGTTLYVQGNVYVSNALVTPNLFASTANINLLNVSSILAGFVGIGTNPGTANLYVQGNAYVSNALTTPNLFSTTANITLANISSISSGFVGIGTVTTAANLYVQGNVYVSNALTTPTIFATTFNVTTINTTSFIYTTSAGIGANPGTTNLYVQGNVFVSASLSAQSIYYGEDVFKRGLYLQPSPANSNSIQAWISATSNASAQPSRSWWASSPLPSFGNVAPTPASTWFGSLLLPDGRVLLVPTSGSVVGFFSPVNSLYTSSPVNFVATGLRGGVLVPNGNVVFVPGTASNAIVLNPLTMASTNVITGSAFSGGALSPTGNVVMCPAATGNIGLLNPTTLTYINVGPTFAGPSSNFSGALLLPNGNIFFGGSVGSNSAMYNTSCVVTSGGLGGNFTNVLTGTSNLSSVFLAPSGNIIGLGSSNIVSVTPTFTYSNTISGAAFTGGAIIPSGNLICAPSGTTLNIGMFDTVALTFSNLTEAQTSGVAGATLLPDGRVVLAASNIGVLSTMTPVDPAFCLSPIFNKF